MAPPVAALIVAKLLGKLGVFTQVFARPAAKYVIRWLPYYVVKYGAYYGVRAMPLTSSQCYRFLLRQNKALIPIDKQTLAQQQIRHLLSAPGWVQHRVDLCDELVTAIVRKHFLDDRSSTPEETFSSYERKRMESGKKLKNL